MVYARVRELKRVKRWVSVWNMLQWIKSLTFGLGAETVMGTRFCTVIWGEFETEKVGRALAATSSATSVLEPYLSWLVEARRRECMIGSGQWLYLPWGE